MCLVCALVFVQYWEAVVSQSSSPVPRSKRGGGGGCRTPPRSMPGSLDSRKGSPKRSSPKRPSPTRSSGEIRRDVRDHRAASYDASHDGDAAADEVEGTLGSLVLPFHVQMQSTNLHLFTVGNPVSTVGVFWRFEGDGSG